MNLVFFSHPAFLNSQSMTRFAGMLSDGMAQRGHTTQIWQPEPRFMNLPVPGFFKKWLGYIDQYIVFRFEVRSKMRKCPADTIYVFTDQALGPWVPWIGNKPHVIHCHDFLAQRSALGQISENPTKWFGRQYQAYIRRGYRKGKNFVSVSKKTQADLHEFLLTKPAISTVVYNGLDKSFHPGNAAEARDILGKKQKLDLQNGYVLHIGGNQWYKNRIGVVEIYNAFRALGKHNLPLLLIGHEPSADLLSLVNASAYKHDIHFLCDIKDDMLRTAYNGASVFVFPSLAEGFGWPIAEAMASGCPVITTGEAPMTEVAGDAGFLISRKPGDPSQTSQWSIKAAQLLNEIVEASAEEGEVAKQKGIQNANMFEKEAALNAIEQIYLTVSQVKF